MQYMPLAPSMALAASRRTNFIPNSFFPLQSLKGIANDDEAEEKGKGANNTTSDDQVETDAEIKKGELGVCRFREMEERSLGLAKKRDHYRCWKTDGAISKRRKDFLRLLN